MFKKGINFGQIPHSVTSAGRRAASSALVLSGHLSDGPIGGPRGRDGGAAWSPPVAYTRHLAAHQTFTAGEWLLAFFSVTSSWHVTIPRTSRHVTALLRSCSDTCWCLTAGVGYKWNSSGPLQPFNGWALSSSFDVSCQLWFWETLTYEGHPISLMTTINT